MTSLLYLIPISIVLLFSAMAAFVWAVKRGQFEDLDSESRRILMDDESVSVRPPLSNSSPSANATSSNSSSSNSSSSNGERTNERTTQ